MKTIFVLVLGLLFAAGCEGAAEYGIDPAQAPASELESSPSDTFTLTSVTTDASGKVIAEQRSITRRDQIAMIEARLAAREEARVAAEGGLAIGVSGRALYEDPYCSYDSLWLFDQPDLQGNMLCLADAGQASLYDFCRGPSCSSRWIDAVRSWWGSVGRQAQFTGWQPGSCGNKCTIPIAPDSIGGPGACVYSAEVLQCW